MDNQQEPNELPDVSQLKLVDFTINDEIRDRCRQICGEYLGGPWSDLKAEETIIEPVEDGLSNRIYVCINLKLSQSKESTLKSDVPSKVLVRLHGSEFVGDQGDMIVVSKDALPLIGEILHQKGLAAKIYGVFDEGRIEHFIESNKFPQESWANQQLLDCLTRKLVQIHQLEMPISKDPWSLVKLAERLYKSGKETNQFLNVDLYEPHLRPMIQDMIDFDHAGYAQWLRDMEPFIKSPCVYCHNDLHFGNVLDRTNGQSFDDRAFIIDYDNSSYGFRAYDLALFLYLKSFIPGRVETWSFQTITTPEEKLHTLKVYLEHLIKVRKGEIDPQVDTIEHLKRELDYGEVLIHFIWTSVSCAKINPMMASVFAIMMDNAKEIKIQVKLAKERCEKYKQSLTNGDH